MKIFTIIIINIAVAFELIKAVETPGNCVNQACNYVDFLVADCSSKPTESTDPNFYRTCLCTQRFEVNLARCLQGRVCAWDGTQPIFPDACTDIFCPGTFDEASGITSTCPPLINPGPSDSLPNTGTPGPRPTSFNPSSTAISGNHTATTTRTDTTASTTGDASGGKKQPDFYAIAYLLLTFGVAATLRI